MPDVLKLLPPFQWRGQKYPVLARTVDFAHERVDHRIQYREGDFPEQTGPHNLTFRYTLAMRESIAKGPYARLFIEWLPVLLADCINREPGELTDPVYGSFICIPGTYSDESDNNKRDGTDIRVEFVQYRDLADTPLIEFPGLAAVKGEAGALDQEVKKATWEQEESPEPTTDPFSAIAGVADQVTANANKVSASLDDVAFRAKKTEDAVDRAENPRMWPLKRSARTTRDTALRAKNRLDDPQKRVVRVTQRFEQSISSVAAKLGMTVIDLLRLNPSLAAAPTVLPGTILNAIGRQ